MRLSIMWGAVFALVVAVSSSGALAASDEKPAGDDKAAATDSGADSPAVDMVFNRKHLSNLDPGKEIVYNFSRTVSKPELLGEPFTDEITLKVVGAKPDGGRDVDMQIYTGERARDLQQMPGRLHNPVFLVYFSQAVSSFSMLTGSQTPYLRRVFSMAFKDKAKVEPVKVDYKGKKIDAYRISMAPYVTDQNRAKMQGWEGAEYTIVVSEEVPGEIVDLIAKYASKLTPDMRLVERITLDGASGLEEVKVK